MKEINPADVPQMIADGRLKFGMILDFSCIDGMWFKKEFVGVNGDNFIAKTDCGDFFMWSRARFPEPKRPDLRDGDPVVVGFLKLHFKKFGVDGIFCYCEGLSRWSNRYKNDITSEYCNQIWRLPTKQELSEAGYTPDQITEMLNRWGVSGTTRVG